MKELSATERANIRRILESNQKAIVDRWCHALVSTRFIPLSVSDVREKLTPLVKQSIDLLLADESSQPRQAEAIGAALADLHCLHPEALGQTQAVLSSGLTRGLSNDQAATILPRLSTLLSRIAVGFSHEAKNTILSEQEQIRSALVTALQKREDALQERDRLLRTTVSNAPIILFMVNCDGIQTFAQGKGLEKVDVDADDLIGESVFDTWTEKGSANFSRALAGETFTSIVDVDQSIFEVQFAPFEEGDEITGVIGVATDITDRKKAEEALQQHVERLEVLHEIDQAILMARSTEEIAEAAMHHIERLVPCKRASVVLLDFEAREGRILAVQTDGETQAGAGDSFPMKGVEKPIEVLEREEVIFINVEDLPPDAEIAKALRADGVQTLAAIPLKYQNELIGAISLAVETPETFQTDYAPIAHEIATTLAIAIQHTRLLESVREQREQLRALTGRLAEAEEAERRRVARVLHDRVGQNLTALGLNLNLIRTHMGLDNAKEVHSRIDDSLRLVEQTTRRVRGLMTELRPPMLEDYGLLATLRWHGEQLAARTGIAVTVQGHEPEPRLTSRLENALFRIAQEALTNVAKHAEATQVKIMLSMEEDTARLVIEDNGVGFASQSSRAKEHQSWGLLTMTERAEAVGAVCRIEPAPGQGTKVTVEVTR